MAKKYFLIGIVLLLVSVVILGCGIPQEQYDAVVVDRDKLQQELQSVKSEFDAIKAELETNKADLETVRTELTEVKEVYPPREFSSAQELHNWLVANNIAERPVATDAESLYSKALEIQEDALKDGYIISAGIIDLPSGDFLVFLTTVIDGNVFMWNPETDKATNYSALAGLWKVH